MSGWQEFPWQAGDPDPARDRLCSGRAKLLDCRIEGANFAREPAPAKDEIVVCAYNVERGLRLDAQLRAFTDDPGMPAPDILLLSEADRGCTRSGNRNVAREYAQALGMCYVYGVEFIELPRLWGPGGRVARRCEHGNAIVSRYPLGNVRLVRHRFSRSWNSAWQRVLHIGEPRLGGRMALTADVRIGGRLLRVYAVHFESGRADPHRLAQAQELIEDAADVPHGVLAGGDMNVGRYLGLRHFPGEPAEEPATTALFAAGYADAHAALPPDQRATTDSGVAIDLLFGRGVRFTAAGIGPRCIWGGLSDHLPVWARLAF
ncbi:MAG TPA: endonuclease/exonuclease/phosphatase family protein [Dehalococcoidia bacterium]|nr:endonuclease/exonuclease/phosphatase family protein [Dehalococcoidia bacterium]